MDRDILLIGFYLFPMLFYIWFEIKKKQYHEKQEFNH